MSTRILSIDRNTVLNYEDAFPHTASDVHVVFSATTQAGDTVCIRLTALEYRKLKTYRLCTNLVLYYDEANMWFTTSPTP